VSDARNRRTTGSRSAGFTLLEVLISLLIISFGLLGLAGLQVISLKNSHSATMRTLATQHAQDIADRMRANMAGVAAGGYAMGAGGATATEVPACLTTVGCTPAQQAANDLFEWQQGLDATASTSGTGLPGGQGVVCIDSTPNDGASAASPDCDNIGQLYVIKVWWIDDQSTGLLKRFVTGLQV
jgi:type IV pilus assembly protein PilV